MKRWISTLVVFALLIGNQLAHCQEKDDGEASKKAAEAEKKEKELAELLEKIAKGPAVVSNIKKDERGRILSCFVVGRSVIPSSLGVAKGIEVAEKRARNAAVDAFTKWLGESVSVESTQDGEVLTITENEKENSKAIDKNSDKFKSVAASIVRGLDTAYYDQNGEDKTYTIVMKYNSKTADAVKRAKSNLNKPDSKSQSDKSKSTAGKGEKGNEASEDKPKSGSIPSKKGVILNSDD